MRTWNQQTESLTTRYKVLLTIAMSALGVLASIIGAITATSDILLLERWDLVVMLGATFSIIPISAGLTYIFSRRERGPSLIEQLKNELKKAYWNALDNSPFNPHR